MAFLAPCTPFAPTWRITLPPDTRLKAPVYIDNLGVIRRSEEKPHSIWHYLKPDTYVLEEARTIQASLPVNLSILHVKAHQDDANVPLSDLPLSSQLNIQADHAT